MLYRSLRDTMIQTIFPDCSILNLLEFMDTQLTCGTVVYRWIFGFIDYLMDQFKTVQMQLNVI